MSPNLRLVPPRGDFVGFTKRSFGKQVYLVMILKGSVSDYAAFSVSSSGRFCFPALAAEKPTTAFW